MQNKEKRVCLAILSYINNSYKSIYNKTVFIECVQHQRGMIYGEDVFIVLEDGSHMTTKIDAIKEMDWILGSA